MAIDASSKMRESERGDLETDRTEMCMILPE